MTKNRQKNNATYRAAFGLREVSLRGTADALLWPEEAHVTANRDNNGMILRDENGALVLPENCHEIEGAHHLAAASHPDTLAIVVQECLALQEAQSSLVS